MEGGGFPGIFTLVVGKFLDEICFRAQETDLDFFSLEIHFISRSVGFLGVVT